jgi:transposase
MLENRDRRPKSAQALALRARIILLCATDKTNTEVGAELGILKQTVGKRRQRFVDKRLDGLLDEPRPGTPRKLSEGKWSESWRARWKRFRPMPRTGPRGRWPRLSD